MKKTELRVIKTKAAIMDALKEMMLEMDISQITVKELSNRAMINRKTFYLHYTCIEALFEDLIKDIASQYFSVIDQVPDNMPTKDVNKVFFIHLAKQNGFVEKLLVSPSYSDFCNRIFTINLNHNRERFNPYQDYSEEEQNIINKFLVSSTLELYRQWVKDGKRLSIDEIVELSGTLLENGTSGLVKK